MVNRKLRNVGNVGNPGIFLRVFFFRVFDFEYWVKLGKHALFRLIQSWQKELDESGFVGTILMDLSKAFECLPHVLMVAELEA